ncbi:G patch domain-containing protein 11 [Venturia canescens]|uniref:G patch domain-containing protein 11 n=1 Tax=Venturia canescens TaxID=32260 RepID=UPI001C9C3D13|nr:G patch domain-containing protein 11 [Venturia canescens]
MSDDEDYMSDKFLQAIEKCPAPSLIYRQSEKRRLEVLKRKAEAETKMKDKNKSLRVIEQEKREEGLSSAISSSNKGFEMLMKMGYKPGQGIGKTESGISEPIGIDIKGNRMGLGKTVVKKSVKKSNPVEKLESMKTDDFRVRLAQRKAEQLAEVDLLKSQRVCEQLDAQKQIVEPREIWFWPIVKKSKESDDESESETEQHENEEDDEIEKLTTTEKLEILTKYLRDKYFYCTWCGATFEDEDDLRDSCPGSTRNDH